ncbi:MAG TPA: 4-alpha-glucanotransferase [Acidobacteriaceae bacterium]|jgi:4-alpha-glucanotransferase
MGNALSLISECQHGGRCLEKRVLEINKKLPFGYHSLTLNREPAVMSLIVTPGTCWLPPLHEHSGKAWGIAAQLYLLRSKRNWGIGDFTDLKDLIEIARRNGAGVIGLNPLHALFPDKPEEASPYSPSDRNLLNVLNIDVEAIPEYERSGEAQSIVSSDGFQEALAKCRSASHVDYETVARLKLPILRILFRNFEREQNLERQRALQIFHGQRTALLDRACLFQALRAQFAEIDGALSDIDRWPDDYRTYHSVSVAQWAQEHPELVRFQLWMQWIADSQLCAATSAAGDMAVGLYRDLAVGSHGAGAERWSHPHLYPERVHVGAPPDIWNPAGQDWGLPPLNPQRLREAAYKPFIEVLQSNMRHAGALRIDHAMALERLYWVVSGGAEGGAFVQYPTDDLIGILALESHRNRCIIIGEDLGTVPKGFRERMAEANVLSYRVLFFERDETEFQSPSEYPALSLSVTSNHDLPTLLGWWRGTDIERKRALGLFPTADLYDEAQTRRAIDRLALSARFQREGLLSSEAADTDELRDAAHAFLGMTKSMLALVQLDDITEEAEQVNIPGTTSEVPNWRRKHSLNIEHLDRNRVFQQTVHAMRDPRGTLTRGSATPS